MSGFSIGARTEGEYRAHASVWLACRIGTTWLLFGYTTASARCNPPRHGHNAWALSWDMVTIATKDQAIAQQGTRDRRDVVLHLESDAPKQ